MHTTFDCYQCGETRPLKDPTPVPVTILVCLECRAQNAHDHEVDMAGGHTALRLKRERQQMLDAGFPEWMC